MALSVIPDMEAFAYVDATPSPLDRVQKRGRDAHLGFGLVRPFRRGADVDFASAAGVELVKACIGQILGMQGSSEQTQGELLWAPERGSLLYRLRHQNNDLILQELGRVYVLEAIRQWEPRVRVRSVKVSRARSPDSGGDNILVILLVYDLVRENVGGNQVFLEGIEQTVELRS